MHTPRRHSFQYVPAIALDYFVSAHSFILISL